MQPHPRKLLFLVGALCASCLVATGARADRVVLVGGGVVEGEAVREGNQVVVEIASGEVTLPAAAVQRIEQSESAVSRFEARYSALRPGDAEARLALADFCREHGMRAREKQLLREILAIDSDHAAARRRLGYVKTEDGWVTRAEAMRARGFVEHEGRWITREELRAIREREAKKAAADERQETAELEAERAALEAARAKLEAERAQLQARRAEAAAARSQRDGASWVVGTVPVFSVAPGTTRICSKQCPEHRRDRRDRRQRARRAPGRHGFSPTPFESSLSVVKVPYR